MARQSFNDFLNSAGPSTPRGRGGFRGGPSRGRGGRGGSAGGWTPGSANKKSFNADYSNVPFNYEKINDQKYTKMEGFNVQQFNSSPAPSPSGSYTPRGRGGYNPRGRGRGFTPNRGGHHTTNTPHAPHTPHTPSGVATPVHGLGFHDDKPVTRNKGDHRGLGSGQTPSTVGKGIGKDARVVTWGGGMAPLFVKAGELFKEGEVDVITMGEDHKLHVNALPLSDPSAPQMTDLRDENEIEIVQEQLSPLTAPESSPSSSEAEDEFEHPHQEERAVIPPVAMEVEETFAGEAEPIVDHIAQDDALEQLLSTERDASFSKTQADLADDVQLAGAVSPEGEAAVVADETAQVDVVIETAIEVEQSDQDDVEEEAPLFFVDTDPDAADDAPVPTYDTAINVPLGTQRSAPASDEENIVFVPKTYRKPEPISLSIGSSSQVPQSAPAQFGRAFVNPRALSRAEKKAAKRDKKRGHKSGKGRKVGREQERAPREDSDIEWGSDGPPAILDVRGGESDEDMKILRDYLEGTKLNARTERAERIELGEIEGEGVDEDTDEEDGEEVDLKAIRLFGQGIKGLTEGGQEIIDEDDVEEWNTDSSLDDDEEALEQDEDDDNDSSVLGELDIEGMISDDDDDEDLDQLFNGSNQWSNETEWFIDAMESALDGIDVNMRDRKSRNKIFKAVEDGDFGDDWGLEPAKKNKKDKHVPPQLQAQWEKDRQAKAEKKKQRELERLIAEIDPDRSGYSRKGKAKAQGKRAKAHQAAVAHLIPASASRVAELFDISSDEEDAMGMPPFRKGGMLASSLPLELVDNMIQSFLGDRAKNSLALPPMGKEERKKVHLLAEAYNLKSKSRGGGKTRFPVLIKTKRSGVMVDEIKIERLLSASTKSGGGFYKALFSRGSGGGAGGKVKGRPSAGPSVRHKEGDMVGHGAEKIGMDNVGHKLLSKMGWAEGDRIGLGAGLEAPIVAIVKNTKMGLGA